MSHKSHMHGGGESYRGVVSTKQPNEGSGGPQEVVEGRPINVVLAPSELDGRDLICWRQPVHGGGVKPFV